MDFERIWNIYSQPILKGIVLIMVGAVQSLFSFFMRLPLDLVHSFLYNLCPMHADVKYLITAWWVMMSWDLAIWIGGVRVISSKFLARNSFISKCPSGRELWKRRKCALIDWNQRSIWSLWWKRCLFLHKSLDSTVEVAC